MATDIEPTPPTPSNRGFVVLRWLFSLVLLLAALGCSPRLIAQEASAVTPEAQPTVPTARPLPDELRTRAPQDLEELRLLEQHIQGLLEKIRPATVSLSGGSGVLVSQDGYILTCAHVNQRPGRTVTVTFPDGKRYKAITMGNNHGIDAGLVKITDPGEFPFVPLGNSAAVQDGEWCLAVGYPVSFLRGAPPAVRLGRIKNNRPRMLVSDCLIMGGDSGGPLFDLDGNVIGINSRVNNSIETNIHVPVDTYRDSWDRLLASDDWSDLNPSAYLGVSRDPDADRARIIDVRPDSPAAHSGLQSGDVIVGVNERTIANFDELRRELGRYKPKDKVQVKLERDGQDIVLDVTLGTWPRS